MKPKLSSWAEFLVEFPHPTLREIVEYRWGSQTGVVDALLNEQVEDAEASWLLDRIFGGGTYFAGLQIINRKLKIIDAKLGALLDGEGIERPPTV